MTTPAEPTRLVVLRGNSASGKPIAHEVAERDLRQWYQRLDLLPGGVETVIPASSSLDAP